MRSISGTRPPFARARPPVTFLVLETAFDQGAVEFPQDGDSRRAILHEEGRGLCAPALLLILFSFFALRIFLKKKTSEKV
jgi:hypothetical protein